MYYRGIHMTSFICQFDIFWDRVAGQGDDLAESVLLRKWRISFHNPFQNLAQNLMPPHVRFYSLAPFLGAG